MSKPEESTQPDAKKMKLEANGVSEDKVLISDGASQAAVNGNGDGDHVKADRVSLQQTSADGATASASASGDSTDTDTAIRKDFSFSGEPTLERIRQLHEKFCDERNWGQYHTPRNILLAMVGEVGETAELFQWKEEVKVGLPGWTDKERVNVEDELSDVLIYLVRLANVCHVDLPAAVLRKMEKNAKKYPVASVYGSSKKYTEYKELKDST